MIETQLGQIIKQIRKQKGYTQDTLAKALGVSQQAIVKYENNQSKPGHDFIKAFREKLHYDLLAMENTTKVVSGEPKEQLKEPAPEYGQPILQVVLNLSYAGKKNADSIDKMADSNLLNAKSIATLVNMLASNSDFAGLLDPSQIGQHIPDNLPAEAFLGEEGKGLINKQSGKKKVKGR